MTTTNETNGLAARLAASKARAEAAANAVTPAMRAEIETRAEIEKHEETVRAATREVRKLATDQALDIARERFPGEALDTIDLDDVSPGAGAYVLRCPPHKMVTEWQARVADTTDAKSRDTMTRNLAMASIIAWIMPQSDDAGTSYLVRMRLDDEKKQIPEQIFTLWTAKAPLAPTSIVNVAVELAGAVAARRKS